MIKVKVNNEYKDVVKIFCGGTLQKEITKVWSREAQDYVYESSVEYTGTFPITITANGDALLDYRIYGADGMVGVATENLVDFEAWLVREGVPYTKDGNGYTITGSLNKLYSNPYYFSDTDIYVSISGVMTIPIGSNIRIYIIKRDGTISGSIALGGDANIRQTVNVLGAGIKFDYARTGPCTVDNLMLNLGRTALPYEPYGYKLPMTVGKNLYNAKNDIQGYYISGNGDIKKISSVVNYVSDKIPVSPGKKYTLYYPLTMNETSLICAFYNDSNDALSKISIASTTPPYERIYNLTAPAGATYFRTSIKRNPDSKPITLFAENVHDVPVYIGENQLDAGEYVSFGEQKIYRDVGGTLTPTDPPVPFPEIPTIDGTTVIDYDGDPKPSQMYVKYRR